MEDLTGSDAEPDLIPLDHCRELLGNEAEDLSDEEVDLLRRHADALAHVLVEIFLERSSRK